MSPESLESLRRAIEYRDEYGLNPLPSRRDKKAPIFPFAEFWDRPAPAEWFTEEGWPDTPNIQIMCGAHWKLFVVDLDGGEALERWREMGECPRTWISYREGGESRHYWFSIPPWFSRPIRKCFVWKGDGEHQGIEILCEKSLVVAPPSLHVRTAAPYRFLNDRHSPRSGSPAPAPKWVLDLVPREPELPKPISRPRPRRLAPVADREWLPSRDEILDGIGDKVALAKSWGVRFTGRISATGWAECHAFDREDRNPSAAVHRETGVYVDKGADVTLPLEGLMVAMGCAHDCGDARARLARRI